MEGKDEERVTFPTGTLEAHLAVKAIIASALLFCQVLKLSIMVFPNLESRYVNIFIFSSSLTSEGLGFLVEIEM